MKNQPRHAVAVAGIIVVVALLLRLIRIGDQELWYDEAFSFHMATIQSGLWEALRIENSPPLYYLLLRAWTPIAGTSESGIRLLSTFFGTLGVAAVIAAGWRLFDRRVGLWAGAVMALSPIHIYYSQEARGYALLICALLVTYILLERALEQPSPGRWIATGLAAVIAIYTHYGALVGLLPSLLLLWWWPSRHPLHKRAAGYGGALLLVALCVGPWVVWCFVLMPHPFGVGESMVKVWEHVPPALAIPKTMEVFGLGHQTDTFPNLVKVYPSLEFSPTLRLIGLVSALFLGLWTIVPWGDSALGISDPGRRKALLWAWLAVPLAVLWLASLSRPVYGVGRYDLIAFPAYVLLLGLAFAKLQTLPRIGTILASLAGLAFFGVLAVKLSSYYQIAATSSPVPSARQTAFALARRVKSGDMVTFNMNDGAPILYYLRREGYRWEGGECRHSITGLRFGCRIFPPEDEVPYGLPDESSSLSSFARKLLFSLKEPDNVLWVVVGDSYISDPVFLAELTTLNVVTVDKVPVMEGATLLAFRPQ